jgi:hypothetical protein
MFHFSRRSVCVTVGGRRRGEIHVKGGEIVHAVHEGVSGEGALRNILEMNAGSIRTGPLESEQRSIERSFQELVLDVIRELDEARQHDFSVSDDAFDSIEGVVQNDTRAANASGACAEIASRVEGALLCAIIDLERRALVGSHAERQTRVDAPALVQEALELFCGPKLLELERLVDAQTGIADSDAVFDEARVVLPDSCRSMIAFHGGRKAAILVTRRETNPGLAFWYLRGGVTLFERELGP